MILYQVEQSQEKRVFIFYGRWRPVTRVSCNNAHMCVTYHMTSVTHISNFIYIYYVTILKVKIYRTIILSVVLYGCETWSLTLREERKLRVFENMVLRRIFEPRRDEVTGEWKRLHYEELNDLYTSPNIVRLIKSRWMRWAGHVARMGEERGCIGSWWGNRREGNTGET